MAVSGNDQVDALDVFGQFIVLALAVLGAAVGQGNHQRLHTILGFAFGNCPIHHSLCRRGRILQNHTGIGGAFVGILTGQTEQGKVYPAPLQDHIVLHAKVFHGLPDKPCIFIPALLSFLRRPIVGIHNGRNRLTAGSRCIEHSGQSLGQIVKFMVSEGGGIIAHGPHDPQLQS